MTAILAVGRSHEEAARSLQVSINKVKSWTNYWSIKLNESKSVHINFSNKRNQYIPISINNAPISYSNTAKYLAIALNAKHLLKAHVKSKREELGLKYKKMYWLLGKHSTFSTYNKLLLYKQIFKPVWTYGIQLWGCAKKTNIDIIQRFQNKVLRNVVNAPLYFRNSDLHRDLDIETVDQAIERFARSHEQRLLHHVNVETIRLLDNTTLVRRLKRTKPFDSRGPKLILVLILEQITQDTEKANKDDTSAPLMTDTQRVMLGFMLKLEQMNVENLITTYLKISEARLLQVDTLQEIDKITRLYVAICKSHKYIGRIRRMCCDAFYFMGDFAIPFFFIVLVSWIQVLPMEEEMENFPMVKVLIQLVNLKSCNFPGYNLLPLRDLLNKYYKYPIEPWNTDNFFRELFNNYMKNPVRPNDFAILLYCKNNSSKWVYEKINTLIRPTLEIIKKENLKATVIILISNIISQFNGKLDGEYVDSARQWLKCMIEGEDVTEVIKESIIISLRKLPKTQKNLKVAML